jgi:hypothetical protein
MKFPALLCLVAFTACAVAVPPPGDPFTSDSPAAATPAGPPIPPTQISVQLDWIRLPHVTANQLIRQRLNNSREANSLYTAVQELITQKKAERINLTALSVRSGQRSKNESIREKPYPTEFEPGDVAAKINAAGEKTSGPVIPASSLSFTMRNLGVTAEVEAQINEDGSTIDLSMAPEWVEHLTDVAWGKGGNEIKQPVFGTMKLSTQIFTERGAWQLAGLFTPPPAKEADKPPGAFPLSPDRVLLFVRASSPAIPNAIAVPPDYRPHQVIVLSEWIEMEAATAGSLLAKYPAFTDSPAMRDDVETMLTDGRASLLQTTALMVRGGQRSKIESIVEYPYPTEFDPPTGGSAPVREPPGLDPSAVPSGSPGLTTVTPSSFAFRNTGTTVDVEATTGEDRKTISMQLSPEIVFNAGTLRFGKENSEVGQPHFQTLKHSVQLDFTANVPGMTGSFDMPGRNGQRIAGVRTRKVLLFVRGIY